MAYPMQFDFWDVLVGLISQVTAVVLLGRTCKATRNSSSIFLPLKAAGRALNRSLSVADVTPGCDIFFGLFPSWNYAV